MGHSKNPFSYFCIKNKIEMVLWTMYFIEYNWYLLDKRFIYTLVQISEKCPTSYRFTYLSDPLKIFLQNRTLKFHLD